MTLSRRLLLGICLVTSLARGAEGPEAAPEVVVLPRFVVTADSFVFSMNWRCKWPTQKSKISRAWFTEIPKDGMAARSGLQKDDRLLKYDEVTLADTTGEWLETRLNRPWRAGEVHAFLIERNGKKLSLTIEVTKSPARRQGNGPNDP
jgi:hypothetical protein